MKYCAVADITDPSWLPDYVATVTRLVEARGGHQLARTKRTDKIEGERALPQIFAIAEWPSKAATEALYATDEYRPYRNASPHRATSEFAVVAAEEVNNAARI